MVLFGSLNFHVPLVSMKFLPTQVVTCCYFFNVSHFTSCFEEICVVKRCWSMGKSLNLQLFYNKLLWTRRKKTTKQRKFALITAQNLSQLQLTTTWNEIVEYLDMKKEKFGEFKTTWRCCLYKCFLCLVWSEVVK